MHGDISKNELLLLRTLRIFTVPSNSINREGAKAAKKTNTAIRYLQSDSDVGNLSVFSKVPRGTSHLLGTESARMSQAQKNKPRLGRGLNSLISVSELPVQAEVSTPPARLPESQPIAAMTQIHDGQPLKVSIESIRPNPHQPRKTIKESAIAELAASMKTSGIIQPLVVRRSGDGFELIAGERRWLAAKLAGLDEVPVVVRDVDSFAQAQMALVENIQREDLNPIERAQGYRVLMDQLGLTQAELAGRMGEDRSSIANFLRLLDLAEPVRNMVRDGRLSLGHAKILAGVADILDQQRLADLVVTQGMAVRNLEKLIQGQLTVAPKSKSTGTSAHIQELEKSLSRQLGTRVQVRTASKGRGRLILYYTSLDQFDDMVARLGGKISE
jgi:ParB family chromosome partitioning protein